MFGLKAKDFLNPVISSGISAVGEYLGSQEDHKSAEEQNATAQAIADRQMAMQEEFAKHGIQWRVADAKAAGIHPLAALGASTSGYSPVIPNLMAEPSVKGNVYRSMGQNLSRAISATSTAEDREVRALQTERLRLENRLLGADVLKAEKAAQVGPGFPSDGNSGIGGLSGQGDLKPGNSPMTIVPVGRNPSPENNAQGQAYGSVPSYHFAKFPDGTLDLIPSPDIQGSLANNAIEMIRWELKHRLGQMFNSSQYRPSIKDHPLPEGKYWKFDQWIGRWRPADIPKDKAGFGNVMRSRYYRGN